MGLKKSLTSFSLTCVSVFPLCRSFVNVLFNGYIMTVDWFTLPFLGYFVFKSVDTMDIAFVLRLDIC